MIDIFNVVKLFGGLVKGTVEVVSSRLPKVHFKTLSEQKCRKEFFAKFMQQTLTRKFTESICA